MKVKETYPKGCEHCGALGYTNYYLTDGKTGSQYTNTCPVCNGAKTVTVTREYEVPDLTIPQIPFVQEVEKSCKSCANNGGGSNSICWACKDYRNWQPIEIILKANKGQRIEKIFDFVVNHKTDCFRAFKISDSHKGFATKEGSLLIEMARKEIGYSRKTYDGDIYNVLHRMYKAIVIDGINSPSEYKLGRRQPKA